MSQDISLQDLSQDAKLEQLETSVIDQVQNYAVLFNKNSKGHRNRNKRQKAYTKIAIQLKISGNTAHLTNDYVHNCGYMELL